MSFLRELCYPVKALGSVTINGTSIARGETIQQFGELRIDLGSYRQDDIVLYNDAIQWSPVSVEGNVLVFNMQSNGKYFIYDNARKIVFDFTVNNSQDFTIEFVATTENTPPYRIDAIVSRYTYNQRNVQYTWQYYAFYVKSTGSSLQDLDVTSSTSATVSITEKDPEYGDDYLRIGVYYAGFKEGDKIDVKVGNVLVAFLTLV